MSENHIGTAVNTSAVLKNQRLINVMIADNEYILMQLPELLKTRQEVAGIILREPRAEQRLQAEQMFAYLENELSKLLSIKLNEP